MKLQNPLKQSLLGVAIEPHYLVVAAWSRGWSGWKLIHRERVQIDLDPMPDVIVAALRPLVLRWGLMPGTPVAVIVPPSIGGVVASNSPRVQKGATNAAEQELVRALPFSFREIEWATESERFGERQTTRCLWLPKAWVTDLKVALSRIAFRLDEVYTRSEVLPFIENREEPSGKKQKQKRTTEPVVGWVEAGDHYHYFHVTQGKLAVSSRVLSGNAPEMVIREIALEIVTLAEVRGFRVSVLNGVNLGSSLRRALESIGLPVRTVSLTPADPSVQKRIRNEDDFIAVTSLARAYKKGLTGFWVVPERDVLLRPVYELSLAIVALGILLYGILYWVDASWSRDSNRLKTEIKKVTPDYLHTVATEDEIMRMQGAIVCAEAINAGENPLDPLYRVYELLPRSGWLDRFSYTEASKVSFSGYGVDLGELAEILKQSPYFANVKVVERREGPPGMPLSFSVEADWVKRSSSVLPQVPLFPNSPVVQSSPPIFATPPPPPQAAPVPAPVKPPQPSAMPAPIKPAPPAEQASATSI